MNRLFTSYKYELQKLIVVRKGWILLLGVILVQLGIALFAAPSQEYVFDKGLYAEYTELYGGEYSEETSVKINEELQEVDTIVNETDLSQITDAEQIEALSEQMILASMKRNALSALQSKYAELSECREYSPILTYDLELNEYISRFGFNWASLVGMLIIIPMLMLGDKNCGMEQILFPTSTGRKAIVCSKLLVGATIGLSMTAVCSALQFIIMALRWDWGSLRVPIQSISGFGECKINGSVLTCMIVCIVIQVLSAAPYVMMISVLSSILKKEPAVISATVIITLISTFVAEKLPSVSMLFLSSAMSGMSSIKAYSVSQLLILCVFLLLKTAIFSIIANCVICKKT
ncbi:MAG: hypothetical protein IKG98_00095 [Ruminococcus sp.]|nr:hypothetical protein [Ruminococcus sp.]MBR3667728.1 hypothetical protein [Ruminococcus sp.]